MKVSSFVKVLTLGFLLQGSAIKANESLQTKVTIQADSAMQFFRSLNVEDKTNTVGDKVIHRKEVQINSESSGRQINVSCSYIDNQGKQTSASCDFNFYVNHQ